MNSKVGINQFYAQGALVNAVATVNPNTVVVVNTVGPIVVEAWVDNPNVTALVRRYAAGTDVGTTNCITAGLEWPPGPRSRYAENHLFEMRS